MLNQHNLVIFTRIDFFWKRGELYLKLRDEKIHQKTFSTTEVGDYSIVQFKDLQGFVYEIWTNTSPIEVEFVGQWGMWYE